jgi:signal transduction histidine kinase/ligand-binding sensor domain-containing protein
MSRLFAVQRFFGIILACVVLAGVAVSSRAAGDYNYFIRTWQVEQGLPQNKVTAVVQTRDGYLWLGTYNGLARFDGVRFTVFDGNNTPQLHSSRVTSLFEAGDGTLWIGDESGHLTQYRAGQFQPVQIHPAWSGGKIYDIAADEAGDVWLMNESGELARVRDGLVLTPPSGAISKVVALTQSAHGRIWVDREGRLSALDHGQLRPVEFAGAATNIYPYIQGIAASRDGGLWVACERGIKKWRDGQWVADFGAAPWEGETLTRLMETRDGNLLAGTSDAGIYLVFPGQTNTTFMHFDRTNGLPSDWAISMWEDREKNLWVGTGAGLAALRPNNLETISPPDQWRGRAVLSVCPAQNGALWIGTEGAGLYRLQDGAWTNFATEHGLRNLYVWSLAEDSGGRLWAGTWGGGLFVQKEGAFDFAPGMENIRPPMPALLPARDGLWVGTTTGLRRYRDGAFTPVDQIPGDVRAIVQDKPGALWIGTAGSGLARLESGKVRWFKKSDGLSTDFVECLRVDDDGTLWIGTFGGGLNRFKAGRFSVINQKEGLPNSVIGHIELDDQGFFWMSSYGGIIRVSEAELNRCADGKSGTVHCLTYGINDGLPTLECSEGLQPAGAKTPDGRLWFPTAKGLVAVNPAKVKINSLPPPVIIEAIRVDDRPLALESSAGAPLQIPPGRHRVEFDYTGLSFVAPEKVRFKCRLNGLEPDWANVGEKRVATYNYIPPGRYSFQVVACNNDGVWNETGASLAFKVLPYFWQTTWFHILGGVSTVLLASGFVWFDTRRRMRRKVERAERQRDIERERTRIARDIHDDLGAQLTRITMLSESAAQPKADPHRSAEGIRRIYDTARELTRSMDEIVWAVSPRHDTLESLAAYLEKFAQDWLTSAGIRCRLDLPLQFPEWRLTSEMRHNVFLAFKEALHNAVKHSGASEVLIRLEAKEKSFELVVEDNGRGFAVGETIKKVQDRQGRAASGNGLDNMRRRLESVGGSAEIQSTPGAGTKVFFFVGLNTLALGKTGR